MISAMVATICDDEGTAVKSGTISKNGSGAISGCDLEFGRTYYIETDAVSYKIVKKGNDKGSIINTTMIYEKIKRFTVVRELFAMVALNYRIDLKGERE